MKQRVVLLSTSFRDLGEAENPEMESLMKRVAEMDRTKSKGEYPTPQSKRYLI